MKNLILLFTIILAGSLNAQTYRYTKTVFSDTIKIADVIYGSAPILNNPYVDESNTTVGDLVMDIYQPKGDTLTKRPVIIFAHGGGFAQGDRTVDDMQAFCDTFARKGYVTATIDYRQGVEVTENGDLHYNRAAYRGLQDGRSAIRFLRANAAIYGIDTSKIYWGGNSAGSFIGLNAIYMDADEIPDYIVETQYTESYSLYTAPDLGGLDIGNNLDRNGEPDAVMACWGGVGDTLSIDTENNQHVFLVHGTADGIVDFNSGTPFGLNGVSEVYGSNSINTRLKSIGIPAEMTYFVEGQDHEFYGVTNGNWDNGTGGNEYWDTVVIMATKFYHNQFKPNADFIYSNNGLTVDFTDNSAGAVSYIWDFGDGSPYNTTKNPSHSFADYGTYNVKLYVENDMVNWDTITKTIIVTLDPVITNQPKDSTNVCPGGNASFSIAGNNIDNYLWQVNNGSGFTEITDGGIYNGATTNTLKITGVTLDMNNYEYRCVVSNNYSKDTSDIAYLTTDNENPTISCVGDQTKQLASGETEYIVSGTEFDPVATDDNCSIASVINDFNNASSLDNAKIPTGTTTIIWTITDNAGNTETCSFDVVVNSTTTGIEQLKQKGVLIYPNPTSGIINFDFADNNIQKLIILDIKGIKIIDENRAIQNKQVSLLKYPNGTYFIKMQIDNKIYTVKIIKE